MLIQIDNPHGPKQFCAGIILENGKVTETAPILYWMKGWKLEKVLDYCKQKNWKVIEINEFIEF